MIPFIVDNYFLLSILIFIYSGHFMKEFQHTCIFNWDIRRVSKHKGIFERIICDCRQMGENTDSSKDCKHISLQKPGEAHCCHWSLGWREKQATNFLQAPQSIQRTSSLAPSETCLLLHFFIHPYDTAERNT